jgi:hypothetical protein
MTYLRKSMHHARVSKINATGTGSELKQRLKASNNKGNNCSCTLKVQLYKTGTP